VCHTTRPQESHFNMDTNISDTCFSAAFVSLRSIIIVELLGIEKLTNSFGLVVLAQGLSTFVGSPIAGTELASLVAYVIQVPSWLHS